MLDFAIAGAQYPVLTGNLATASGVTATASSSAMPVNNVKDGNKFNALERRRH